VESGRLVLLWLSSLIIEHLSLVHKDLQIVVSHDETVFPPRTEPLYFSALFWQRSALSEARSTLYWRLDLYGAPFQKVAVRVNENETATASLTYGRLLRVRRSAFLLFHLAVTCPL
jgi:hypothetical protein